MLVYILFALCVLVLLFFYKITELKVFVYFVFIICIIFAAFRVNVGVDYQSYVDKYDLIIDGNNADFEIGSRALISLSNNFGLGVHGFFFFMALITNLFIYLFIMRHSKNVVISIVFYVFFTVFFLASFNAVRQYASISICLFSLRFIIEKRFSKYIFWILLASTLHSSAILTLPLYFFLSKKFKPITLFIGGGGVIAIIYYGFNFVATFLFHSSYLEFYNNTTSRSNVALFIFICSCFLFLLKNDFVDIVLFKNMIFISVLLLTLSFMFPMFSMGLIRLNSFYLFSLVPLISYLPYYNKVDIKPMFLVFLIFVITFLYFFTTLYFKGESYNLVPYQSLI